MESKISLDDIKKKFNNIILEKFIQDKKSNYEIKADVLKDSKINNNDSFLIGDSRLDEIGFVEHHISSFNHFVENGYYYFGELIYNILTRIIKFKIKWSYK